jgi:serine/threonine-protein kinase
VKSGLVLQGKYRLVSLLGQGGMGSVWRAEDLQLQAPIAVKLMHAELAAHSDWGVRFEREARSAASLRSPHVVQVLDFGVATGTDLAYIAMELLDGESLRERLARTKTLAPLEAARLVSHIARALARAHEAGVVHRDLKPANVFLVKNDDALFAKVLDFGIAKWPRLALEQQLSTLTNRFLGTPHYMSPEQIESAKHVDFRADLWSVGVLAFECLTGKLPFESKHLPELAFLITQGAAKRPSALASVPVGFDAWFERATARRPEQRFSSARQMASELERLCTGGVLTGAPDEHLLGCTTRQPGLASRKDASRP